MEQVEVDPPKVEGKFTHVGCLQNNGKCKHELLFSVCSISFHLYPLCNVPLFFFLHFWGTVVTTTNVRENMAMFVVFPALAGAFLGVALRLQ